MRQTLWSASVCLVVVCATLPCAALADDAVHGTSAKLLGENPTAGLPAFDGDSRRPGHAGTLLLGIAEPVGLPGRARVGVGQLKLGTTQSGVDPKLRDAELNDGRFGAAGGGLLPLDVRALPQPAGDPASGGPSPMISARDRGGVVGFSYKIRPQ